MTIWVLTIGESAEPPNDELSDRLADRVKNLPSRFASAETVRDLIGQLKVAGMLRHAREFRFTTLNGQPAQIKAGANQPRVVATKIDPRPGRAFGQQSRGNQPGGEIANQQAQENSLVTNSVTYEPTGTIIRVWPSIDASASIRVQFDCTSSDIEKDPHVVLSEVTGRAPLTADKITTQQVTSTVRLKSGTAMLVHSDSTQTAGEDPAKSARQLIILAAAVEPALD
jgi:hypothetical protein